MSRTEIRVILLAIVMLFPLATYGQGIDGVRAFTIEKASLQAKKTIEAQMKVQGLHSQHPDDSC